MLKEEDFKCGNLFQGNLCEDVLILILDFKKNSSVEGAYENKKSYVFVVNGYTFGKNVFYGFRKFYFYKDEMSDWKCVST